MDHASRYLLRGFGLANFVALSLAACSSAPSGQEPSRSVESGVGQAGPIVGLAGKCLDANGGSSANGTRVQLWTCNGTAAQQWTLSNGQILGPGGKCLDATGNSSASGTLLQLWDCWGGPNQQWAVQGKNIVGIGGKCVDVQWAGTADGTPVQLWDCNGTAAQDWTVGAAPTDPCAGSSVFCDDYTSSTLASAYHTVNGTWTRQSGDYLVSDTVTWERARAVLSGDYGDFDVTIDGSSLGDAGFGLVYAASDDTHGYAVLVHPAQFQGVYLKQLVPGSQDIEIKNVALSTNMAGQPLTLRVKRSGTTVTVWLNGAQQFTADDGGTGAHGQLGLLESTTDNTSGSGAHFTLLRLDSATTPTADAGGPPPPPPPPPPVDAGSPPPVPALCAGKNVIFRDDFDGTSLDTTKWNTKYAFCGSGCCSLPSNGEQECYDPGQVQVYGGALHLIGTPQTQSNGLPYASGMISSGGADGSAPKFDFQYGYFEARVKIPAGQGLWPAFWTGNSDGSWPPEIDVMEILGNAPDTWYGTVHYSTAQQQNNGDGTSWVGPDFSQDWHTFGVDWEPGSLIWYIDGAQRKVVTAADEVQSKRAFVMANLAVGGGWPGNPNSSTPFPADYQVDYIVVCQ